MSSSPLRIAVAGLGRMGVVHALHCVELARETGSCVVTALADPVPGRAAKCAADIGCDAPVFDSVNDLAAAKVADATVVVTPTENHQEHAAVLVAAGQRVLLEKPLTGTLEGDLAFAAELDRNYESLCKLPERDLIRGRADFLHLIERDPRRRNPW